jgi:ribosomal protein S12 methylthiotransferase accessory factor
MIAAADTPSILDKYDDLVDDRTGIIRHVCEIRREAGTPGFVYLSAETCNLKVLNPDLPQGTFWGAGVAADRTRAAAKAVGEAVERYCAAQYAANGLPLTSVKSAPFDCVRPEEFALFSSEQHQDPRFPFLPFCEETPIRWVPTLDLLTGATKYVPAAMVFLPYVGKKDCQERLICPQMSTGLACHTSLTVAALSAACEVIERDAIAITWQAMLAWPQIRLETLTARNADLVDRLRRPEASVHLLFLEMDHGIPTFLSAMRSTVPDAPALVIAAAAHLDPEVAVQKSLEELAQTWTWAQREKATRPKFAPGAQWEHVIDPETHAATYFDQTTARRGQFLFGSRRRLAFQDIADLSVEHPADDLRFLVHRLHAISHRVFLADVTSEDVRGLGLHVVRALIPGFHPLFMGHRFRALGGTRLWTLPQQLGHRGIAPGRSDNPHPHPFA